MGAHIPEQPSFIEGIGDEIVTFLSVFVSALVYINFSRSRRVNRPSRIHPEFAAHVESTRRLLHQQCNGTDAQDGSHSDHLICPICRGEAAYAIETNCGHVYCGQCFLAYWQHRDWFGAVPCPSCKTRVTLMLRQFRGTEAAEGGGAAQAVRQGVHSYNLTFSAEPRTIMDDVWDLPTLLRHAWNDHHFTLRTLFHMNRLLFVVVAALFVVYLFSPFDLIPEAAFGVFGLLDDFFLFFLLLLGVSVLYRRVVLTRAQTIDTR